MAPPKKIMATFLSPEDGCSKWSDVVCPSGRPPPPVYDQGFPKLPTVVTCKPLTRRCETSKSFACKDEGSREEKTDLKTSSKVLPPRPMFPGQVQGGAGGITWLMLRISREGDAFLMLRSDRTPLLFHGYF